uniref:C2H2-type domain-containing protein n=1 Tax=Anopheles dirus TaxID=7168 RepID=A0A9I3EGZ8_9DIPT
MDIFQNQCSESLGFDSMLSSNHLNSPLHDSPGSPNPLTYAPSSPYFASISQQSGVSCGHHTSGPNDVILPSIFVKIPTQINQQYQQENRLRAHHSTANEIKCEERTESIKSEVADTRGLKLVSVNSADQLPDVIDNYLNDAELPAQPETSILLCELCPFATLCETRIGEHRRELHPPQAGVSTANAIEKLDCPVCENKFYKPTVLELHLADDHQMLRSEVETLCQRTVNPAGRQTDVMSVSRAETMVNNQPAPNKSRIYIKNVQLLKKPDVIAQETRHESVPQVQQLLSTEQQPHQQQQQQQLQPSVIQDNHQLTLAEDMLPHAQTIDLQHASQQQQQQQEQQQHHQQQQLQQQQQQQSTGNGNKIFIRNVSLLQNVNFVPSAENILSNGGSKYSTTSAAASYHLGDSSSPTLINTMNGSYSAVQAEPIAATQPKGSRIYIKNVDILRNPLISLDESTATANSVASFNDTITSRASSCESIICTSTPPASTEQQTTVPPVTAGSVMSHVEIISSPVQLVPPPASGTGDSSTATYTVGPPMEDTSNLLMLFSTPLEGNGNGEPGVSYMHEFDVQPSGSCPSGEQGQQGNPSQQRKSKIFIKNISVLKQPTIHLKSVDEVNLMTYDELQLQNMLPMAVSQPTNGGSMRVEQRVIDADTTQLLTDRSDRMEKPFGGKMIEVDENHSSQDDVMDGYHESDLAYGDLGEVCDFGDSFNERDDPGGGDGSEEVALVGASAGDDSDLLGESLHCEAITASAFSNDLILLQDESNGHGKIWLETSGGGSSTGLGQEVLQAALETHADLASCLRRDEDLMLDDAQHVINLDPPTANDSQPTVEQSALLNDTFTTPVGATVPTVERILNIPRARGRPKGAKQTGITKLKKLYTNLTAEEEGYKCDLNECGVRFRQPDRLDYHRRCHVPGEAATIHCPECESQEFRNWNTLHTHLWREHAIDMELYACHLCSFKTPVLCRLNNTHMKIHSEERNFKCAICGKAFKNNKQLRNHRRWHREPPQQQQQQQPQPQEQPQEQQDQEHPPEEVPPEPNESSDHKQPSPQQTPPLMKCVKCGLKFAGKRQLRTHMDAKHPTDAGEEHEGDATSTASTTITNTATTASKHRCLLCGMVFRTRYLLQSHAAKHSDEKRFKCEHCEYTTNDHNAFRRHKMRHSAKGAHRYKCSYCDYSSIQSTTYRKHLERMHADVASTLLYKCAHCPFVSISELKYQLHRAKHEGGAAQPTTGQATESDPEQVRRKRQSESVNSEVMIVEQHEQQQQDQSGIPSLDVQPLEEAGYPQQHPIIRPAMFANNFSKVDNFYGYQPQHEMVATVVTTLPAAVVPVQLTQQQHLHQQQQQQQQHEFVNLSSATTGDVTMRELN